MRKQGGKLREIRFYSDKNERIIIVHSQEELSYAKRLEEDPSIAKYIYGKAIDSVKLKTIKKVDIRGAYLKENWETSFYVMRRDTSVFVRELIRPSDLTKLSEIEKLELSRRYWKLCGVSNWKVVMEGGSLCS